MCTDAARLYGRAESIPQGRSASPRLPDRTIAGWACGSRAEQLCGCNAVPDYETKKDDLGALKKCLCNSKGCRGWTC